MKILVTGGAGYIGSHAAHQLTKSGYQIVVLDNLYSGHRWAVPESAEFIEGDVGDQQLLDRIFREQSFQAVMHFAAHIEVGESMQNPAKYYFNNTTSALKLFETVRRSKVPNLIFSSTAAVYGEPETALLNEKSPLQPMNPYGASKAMTERILQDIAAASEGSLRYVILRYFNVAGAQIDGKIGQATPRATHLIKTAAETALGLRPQMAIYGTDYPTKDGTGERDYIHVEDLVQAHLDALSYLNGGGQSDVFNVGYGHAYSVREVLRVMKQVSGIDFKVVESPRRAGDPSGLAADNSKIRQVLGWIPRYDDLEIICRTAFEWEKSYLKRTGVIQ